MDNSQSKFRKSDFLKAYQKIQTILADKALWKIGASGALLIHGINYIPSDIDIVVHTRDYEKVATLMKDYIVGETKDFGFTVKTLFIINDIEGEIFSFDYFDKVEMREIDGYQFPVTPLETELKYYKLRTDKPEATRLKIKLIEEELLRRTTKNEKRN